MKALSLLVCTSFVACGRPVLQEENGHSHATSNVPKFALTAEEIDTAKTLAKECAQILQGVSLQKDNTEALQTCLSNYIKIDTRNPNLTSKITPEEQAAIFLKEIFDELRIPSKSWLTPSTAMVDQRPRWNFVATLQAKPDQAAEHSIILLHHMDVVDVNSKQWTRPELAFSGNVEVEAGTNRKYIWGRGALDMKSIGIMQLVTLVGIRNDHLPLTKDIHFVAVSDEEEGASGATGIIREMKIGGQAEMLRNASAVLNEGGFLAENVLGESVLFHVVATEEKGGAWLRLAGNDLQTTLRSLMRLKIPNIDDQRRWFESIRGQRGKKYPTCEVSAISTVKQKINVVPSEVDLTFGCQENINPIYLASVFHNNDPKVGVNVVEENNLKKIKITTESSSHGALALNKSALDVLLEGLIRLGFVKQEMFAKPAFYEYEKTPATVDLMNKIGSEHDLKLFGFLRLPHVNDLSDLVSILQFIEQRALKTLGSQLSSERLFRTSCSWTGFDFQQGAKSDALIDCRLLKPKSTEEFTQTVQKIVTADGIQVNKIKGWDFASSPAQSEMMQAIQRAMPHTDAQGRKIVTTQFLSPVGSDNVFFRLPKHGDPETTLQAIPAYGFFPVELPTSLLGTIHGSDERIPVDALENGSARYSQVVYDFVSH